MISKYVYTRAIRDKATDLAMVTIQFDHAHKAVEGRTLHTGWKSKQPRNIHTTALPSHSNLDSSSY